MELGWELPFPNALWEAQNSQIWLQRVSEHFGASEFTIHDNFVHGPRGLATASLSIATQQLMAETPNTELLSALESSPIAILFVLTNLGALVRDFTRCYYQMRPSLSDPSAFHILTQLQNKQIHTAVRAISKIVDAQAYTDNNPHFLLWRSIELLVSSIRVSLCRPDQLLIGGIVDNSLIAGMAASTHLTLGSYVATRRSVTLLSHHADGDEGILAILSDLSGALAKIAGNDKEQVRNEAPWITVCNYNILLCIWGALRHASRDIRLHLDTFNELPRISESCILIFNTLMESTLQISSDGIPGPRDPRLWSIDRDVFTTLLEEGEPLFVNLIREFCNQRFIWGIGPSMQTVLNEIHGADDIITALA